MRLCIATPLYPPESGGPATYARTLERGLPEQGDTVTVVKFSEVRHLPKLIRHFQYFLRIVRFAGRSDVILALDPVSVGLPALLAAFVLRKPFVVKIVGDYAWEQGVQRAGITDSLDAFVLQKQVPLFVRMLRTIQTFVARHATGIIVPSLYLKGIVTTWGIDSKKIEVIYNAVAIDVATLPERTLPAHTIITAGRLVPWKGIQDLIDALVMVRKEIPDARLVIIGDGPEREALEMQAADFMPGAVLFLGALTHTETLAQVQAADIFVLNSTYEGLSHMLIEALMLGKPIVASRAGGNPELITNDENGLLVSVGATEALANALVTLLQDEARAARLATQASASVSRSSHEKHTHQSHEHSFHI
jgi:glycosyltransferase involved in cell wall biosynthesis